MPAIVGEIFWKKVDKKAPDKCWTWTKFRNKDGYGGTRDGYRKCLAHRLAYILHHNLEWIDIENTLILHSCDNPPCCNPAHLRKGLSSDNSNDMKIRGRHTYGERSALAKLSTDDVFNIKKLHERGIFYKDIAEIYKISKAQLCRIMKGKRWAHI